MKSRKATLFLFSAAALLAVGVNSVSAGTITIGQNLTNRPSRDTAFGSVFIAESFGFSDGTVTDWSLRSTSAAYSGTRNITPVILEQTGSTGLGGFTIRGIGTTQSLSHSAGAQTFSFGLTSGSAQMGPRHYLGWIDSDAGSGTNQGVISYSGGDHFTLYSRTPGSINVGDPLPYSANLNRRYSLQATIDVGGEAVGNGAGQRGHADGAWGGVFVVDDPFTQGGWISEWAFWSWTGGNRWITPLLFEQLGGDFLLRGVGTSRLVPTTQGTITYDFELVSGSDVVNPDYYFGWVDAAVNATGDPTNNQGLIRFADDETFSAQVVYLSSSFGLGKFTPGTNFGGGSTLARAYSVQALAVVPEPSTFALAALGLMGLAFCAWRKRRCRWPSMAGAAGAAGLPSSVRVKIL